MSLSFRTKAFPEGKALVREENLQTKIIRLGFDSPSRLFFYYIVFRILHVLTRVCVYPHAQTSAARTAHRSSGNVTLHSARLWKVGWSDNHHQRRVRKGVCTYVAIAFLNAAMIFFSPSNVSSADWVKRHACGLPTAAAVRIAHCGSGYAGNSMDCSTASYILRFSAAPSARVTNCTT